MTAKQFGTAVSLHEKNEMEKTRYLAFFHLTKSGVTEFTVSTIAEWFGDLNLTIPNLSRLRSKLRASRSFVKGSGKDHYRLHAKEINELTGTLPALAEESETIVSSDTIIPASLVTNTRGFIESLARQINASYEQNIFDGCAVLMRRLVEVLLILAYQANGIESKIKGPSGEYKNLSKIIGEAITNSTLALSKNTKACLDDFRVLGNFSAHEIYYNAKRNDVKKEILRFRAAVEELLYKAGIKT